METTTIITSSFEETQKSGFDFAKKVEAVSVLALHGDLGSGKTTFIQGLAKGLGINKKIISPTFIIMRTYELPVISRYKRHFYHLDLYRINNEKDVKELGLMELINDTSNLLAIEWPEKIFKILPEKRLDLHFEYIGENKRKIRII
jgi:tRNA threonylcarbamoyladenosine biosynthesis protein TsaE